MKYESEKLGELSEIVRGSSPRPQGDPQYYGGNIPRLMIADITRDGKYVEPKIDSLTEEGAKKSRTMQAGEVVVACSGNVGLPAILKVDACIHDGFIGFRNLSNKLNPEFLYHCLLYLKDFSDDQSIGSIFRNLTTTQISNFQIPLPPLAEQQAIVSEISGYQKIVDGARQVVDNYRPRIVLKEEWEWVELGEVCEKITKGSSPNWQGIEYVDEGGILFVTSENVGAGEMLLAKRKFVDSKFNQIEKRSILQKGDVLTNIVGASIGRTAIFDLEEVANINQAVCLIRVEKDKLSNVFLMILLNSDFLLDVLHGNKVENARANLSLGFFEKLKIPLPSLAEQQAIVQQIEQEQALVSASRELISVFEEKIRARVARVWG